MRPSVRVPLIMTRAAAWSPTDLGSDLAIWLDAYLSRIETDGAAALASASSQYFSATGTAGLRGAAGGWWRAGMLYMSAQGTQKTILSTLSGNDGMLIEVTAANVLSATIGTGSATVTKAHGTTLSADTWYFWYVEYDGTNLGLSINAGALATEAAAAFSPGSANFNIGATLSPGTYWNGRLGHIYGGDGHDEAAIPASLYASNNAKFYVDVTSAEKTAWDMKFAYFQVPPGLTADSHGSQTLTNNATATYAPGPTRRAVWADGQPVSRWYDVRETNFSSPTKPYVLQATAAARPLYKTNVQNGKPWILFDGTDDFLTSSTEFTRTSPQSVVFAGKQVTWTNNEVIYTAKQTASIYLLRQHTSSPHVHIRAGENPETLNADWTLDTFAVVTCRFEYDTNLSDLRVNKLTPVTMDAGSDAANGLTVGAENDGGFPWSNIACSGILCINADINDQPIDYLMDQWGVS